MGRKDHGMEIMGDVDRIRAQRVLVRLRAVASELSGYEPADLNEASTFLELGFDSLFLTQLATAFPPMTAYGMPAASRAFAVRSHRSRTFSTARIILSHVAR